MTIASAVTPPSASGTSPAFAARLPLAACALLLSAAPRLGAQGAPPSGGPEYEAAAETAQFLKSLQETIASAGEGAVIVQTFQTFQAAEALHVFLLTPNSLVARESQAKREVFQRLGASAVLASLWPVSGASTALLMGEFYRLRYAEGKNKAEALRGAQLSVMSAGPAATAAPQAAPAWTGEGFSHPYYWSGFFPDRELAVTAPGLQLRPAAPARPRRRCLPAPLPSL
ncbi:MAG: CHAT domain-containing protein [Deltaproteobacteria bacterium]|nr:CHAT domain-containing protein [Deltaproteobacteria bacterium]